MIPTISIFGYDSFKDPTSLLFWQCFIEGIGNGITASLKSATKASVGFMSNVFPFNFPIKIYMSWQNAKNEKLPNQLQWLNMIDQKGNVVVNMPMELIAQEEDYEITFWGPDVFYFNETLENAFIGIKYLSIAFFWFLFIVGIWIMGEDIYNIITGKAESIDQEKKEKEITENKAKPYYLKKPDNRIRFYKRKI